MGRFIRTTREMGQGLGKGASAFADQWTAHESHFTKEQVRVLRHKFEHVATKHEPKWLVKEEDFSELLHAVGFDQTQEEVLHRLFAAFDGDKSGMIDMREYAIGLSALIGDCTWEEKARFAFEVYDLDNSGLISKDEMVHMLCSLTHMLEDDVNKAKEKQAIVDFVDKVFEESDLSHDNQLSLPEFTVAVMRHPELVQFNE